MEKVVISTKKAPAALGAYSQAIKIGDLLFTSGQIPLDPATGELISDDITKATERSMENLKAVLEEAGTSFEKVVKTVIFLKDMNDFAAVNEVYAKYFKENPPARSCVQVGKLPKDALVEIELVAMI
ncbi:TPA: RidA family protein [Clostridium botulinum]|jgi:2-iminobutanoate/2-iminopropanoate deaminase|uniref:Reactive intermediate/imine deaminase family protein n=4 Tax=Clostridium TaxID=1485 RepID=A0A1J1CTD1_CLOSG|nr:MULTISPECIES: RidA family protein [Clostridium]MBE6078668.1 RidA family protein [Clostridium lundense]APF25774.1 reactive intermediate/imine deaminase family protein [Clostridium sporogenes]APH14816.1 reactive intermediate/imine deaminase family protein [Clostridium sporogenes]AUM96757.1 RidA family protein [Clostridium sporogenes]AVQ38886.1 RidA family protein [Clostridium botulinum]